ncbi:RNA polymerase subunit sigma-70 [Streptomyces sp. CT34]|uniref:RNA polymerase subunit sigma-70 n=1 Tax=Streptomyces sp. CT34 TaxID=1553907 RepID=UPI001F518260|nr:RNA polymerase subunit sigma-70 [Streptomyces sp. CT34]
MRTKPVGTKNGATALRAAALLTGEPAAQPAPAAEELLIHALARTYAAWDRLHGEDPYERTRRELAAHFAHTCRRHRRRMLRAGPHPPVPPGLAARATARGRRLRERRRVLRRTGSLLALLALITLLTWAVVEQPWRPPPARTTPPVEGW